MKIRLDFVTNSSSSSFTCVALYSEDLYKFLQQLISEKKYRDQPDWSNWKRPEEELHLDWVWEELSFDERWFKVQTTEEYGDTDKVSVYKWISLFFDGLTTDEDRTLKELIFEVYKNKEYQTHKYKDYTDGFTGFHFNALIPKSDKDAGVKNEKIKELIDTIDKMAVDPESEEMAMSTIAMQLFQIAGQGSYSIESDRYAHIDKSFLDKVKLGWVDPDYTAEYRKELLDEEKRKKWAKYLQGLYEEAIDEVGAIHMSSISSRIDYAVITRSMDDAVSKYALEIYLGEYIDSPTSSYKRLTEEQRKSVKRDCFIVYLKGAVSAINDANKNKGDGSPVRVIWEDQFYDYLMKHTSLGGVEAKPVVGPNGTVRLKIPEKHKRTMDSAITEMVTRWPSRIINPKTKTYEKIVRDFDVCNKDIGYASKEAFFDAYGFSVRQNIVNKNAKKTGDFLSEKNRKNEVTIVKYTGNDVNVSIPESIEGGIVKVIGKEAFYGNDTIEEVFIPECVDTIRGKAFGFCRSLKKIRLSNSISKILEDTFGGCDKLEEINIPDMVQELPPKVFQDCPLKSLYVGKSLSEVRKQDFYQGVRLSDNTNVFEKTCAMESIIIDSRNKNLKSIGSMILSYDGKILYAMLGEETSCTVPDGVEIIADYAFSCQGFLTQISLPESLQLIGNYAFDRTGLESVSFPCSLKIIGAYAFRSCKKLTTIEFSEGLEEIYTSAFLSTEVRRVSFPNSLKKLGRHSFIHWSMESIEPEQWRTALQRNSYPEPSQEFFDTQNRIKELKYLSSQARAASQVNDNAVGLGVLAAMMSFLQSDAAKVFDVSERIKLERIVISEEMESVLGTDLKLILSFYKDKAAEKLSKCFDCLKSEPKDDEVKELFVKINEAFPDDKDLDVLLGKVIMMIGKEA